MSLKIKHSDRGSGSAANTYTKRSSSVKNQQKKLDESRGSFINEKDQFNATTSGFSGYGSLATNFGHSYKRERGSSAQPGTTTNKDRNERASSSGAYNIMLGA